VAVTEYATLTQLKDGLKITDTASDTALSRVLVSASRQIDRYTGRRFYLDDAVSPRIYRPARITPWDRDGQLMLTDDFGSITGLVVEMGTPGSWTAVTDYETHPDNALTKGQPVTGLLRLAWWFGGYGLRLRVTAQWGWPSVPAEVTEATLIQAARLYRRKDSPEGVLGSADWGAIRVSRIDPDVQALISHLVLPAIG
jgi:hypothetical protein